MKLSELASTKPPKVLLWGDVGCGKTALGLTLGSRCQVIDCGDDGLATGMSIDDAFRAARGQVDVAGGKPYVEPAPHRRATVFNSIKAKIFSISDDCAAGKYPFDALLVDSLSSFAEAAVSQIMYNSSRIGQSPELQHWGAAFIEIKNVIAVMRSLPIVVVLSAHEQVKSFGKGNDKEDKLEIAVSGKNLASQITRYFDEIYYMRVKPQGQGKYKRTLQTMSDGTIPCRTRGGLPDNFDSSVGMWEIIKKLGYVPPERKEITK